MAQINIKKTNVLDTPSAGLMALGIKQDETAFLVNEDGTEIPIGGGGGGGGLEGTQYVYVAANGTDVENAAELQAAYTTAQGMNPSATNRITVIAAPANYNFASNSVFVMSTQFIDLVSLDGNRSIIFNGAGSIIITANDVFVKGVNVTIKNFTIATNLDLLKVENCQGGDFSFGGDTTFGNNPLIVNGTFTNCQGGDFSFGAFGTASGTFKDCQGGSASFGCGGTASGTFTNCQGGFVSFGGEGTASGTFTDCQGGDLAFGGYGTASGTFKDCQGGSESFGGQGTSSGTFTDCQGGFGSFGGNAGTASGTFTDCQGGFDSFGGSGTLNGKLFYCRLFNGTFQTVSGAGITRLCIDGNNNENNQANSV